MSKSDSPHWCVGIDRAERGSQAYAFHCNVLQERPTLSYQRVDATRPNQSSFNIDSLTQVIRNLPRLRQTRRGPWLVGVQTFVGCC